MQGRLKSRPLDSVLSALRDRSASGILTLEKRPIKRQICLLKGFVRLAVSNVREERLAEFLMRGEHVTEEAVRAAEAAVAEGGTRFAQALVDQCAITSSELQRHVRRHVLDQLIACFELEDAEFRFKDGVPNIVGEMTVEMPPLEILLERCRRKPSTAVHHRMQSTPSLVLHLDPSLEADLKKVRLTGTESYVLTRADGQQTLPMILSDTPFDETETIAAIAALGASGIVSPPGERPEAGPRVIVRGAPDQDSSSVESTQKVVASALGLGAAAPQARAAGGAEAGSGPGTVAHYERIYALLKGADHYRTLDLAETATASEARDAYYRLAKELHPDKFLIPPLDALHGKMEELFAQILEAYRTLTDQAARERYDTERRSAGQAPRQTRSDTQELARQNYLRGKALVEMGKMTDAVKFLQNAVDAEQNNADYRRTLASAQAGNPRLRREAIANYARAIELEPAVADTYLKIAMLYRRIGEMDKAEASLRECLKRDPWNPEAGRALAEIKGERRRDRRRDFRTQLPLIQVFIVAPSRCLLLRSANRDAGTRRAAARESLPDCALEPPRPCPWTTRTSGCPAGTRRRETCRDARGLRRRPGR
jgi:curved DNA-binding protein CbpA